MSLLSAFSDHLSRLYLPGAVALWCALAFALVASWGYASALGGADRNLAFGRRAYHFFAWSIVLTSVVMALVLVLRDFRIEYVFQYSGLDLPINYQFAAFWAGQKGSFLIWLLWATLLGVLVARSAGAKSEPAVMSIYLLTVLGLLLILVRENPFIMLNEAPPDGKGLNPLLQDDWMVIHPPIMFVGYSLTAVPFAFAIAALWRRDFSDWAARAFPWALAGFLVLGTAILMGGYWAYKTLGWGGYWGWDPVENASLIPWLFTTTLIHGLHLERAQGRFRRANLILACLGYLSVLYGTFLTRSGVLADFSVHSFVDLGISGLLIFLMGFFLVLSVVLLAMRLPGLPTKANEDPAFSRGAFMVVATLTILISALVVTIGTSSPILTRFMENPAQVGPSFYNTVHGPLALLIALLLAAVPFLTWRGLAPAELLKKCRLALVAGVVVGGVAAFLGVLHPLHLSVIFFAAVAIVTNVQGTIERSRAGGLKAAGGYLTHVGVGVMLIGFLASSAYDHSTKVTLEQGVAQKVDDLELTFTRFVPRDGREKERMEVRVVRPDGSVYMAYPQLFVNDRTRQLMAHPHIRNFMTADLYISPLEYDPGREAGEGIEADLTKGDVTAVGDANVRFVDFDLGVEGNALAQMQSGGVAAIGAVLELERGGRTETLRPIYRFNAATGQVQFLPLALPGGGQVAVTGINPQGGLVRLQFFDLGARDAGEPAKLALDVTHKPLIQLVWIGLYVVIAGSLLAMLNRLKQARIVAALPKGGKVQE